MELPSGWAWATLEDVLAAEPRAITDGPFGSNLKSAHYTDDGARVLRLQNVGDGVFRDARAFVSLEHFETLRNHDAVAGDLILASLGEILPRAAIVPDLKSPAIVKADVIRARIHGSISTKWVLYALMSPYVRKHAASRIKGVGRPRIGLGEIRKLPIPIPPLAEQYRIADAIEGHLTRIEAATSLVSTASRRAQMLQESLLQKALGECSIYPSATLSELIREPLRNGHSARVSESGHGVRTLSLSAVTNGDFSDRNAKVTVADPERVKGLWLIPGDILIQRSNTPDLVGTSALYLGPEDWAIYPDLLIRVRVNERILPEFAAAALRSPGIRSYFRKSAKGLAGSMPKIDQATISNAKIPVPPIDIQREIVKKISAAAEQISWLSKEFARADRRAQHLVRALLQTAFAGALVPHDPEDEPGVDLLNRIQAERDTTNGKATRRRARKTTTGIGASTLPPTPPAATPSLPRTSVQQEFEL